MYKESFYKESVSGHPSLIISCRLSFFFSEFRTTFNQRLMFFQNSFGTVHLHISPDKVFFIIQVYCI